MKIATEKPIYFYSATHSGVIDLAGKKLKVYVCSGDESRWINFSDFLTATEQEKFTAIEVENNFQEVFNRDINEVRKNLLITCSKSLENGKIVEVIQAEHFEKFIEYFAEKYKGSV